MNRKDFLLKYVNKDKAGLEIGPSHNPIAPKSEGYNVEIIDHTDEDGLIKKYKNDASVDVLNIEKVDYVWEGQTYKDLTKKSQHYHWIIASHVIEHTTDFIRFINDCNDLLTDSGKLILAVPDYRFCFDQFRAITGLSKVIDAHSNKHTLHSIGTIAEFHLNVSSRGGKIAWKEHHSGKAELLYSHSEAMEIYESAKNSKEYLDAHAWCFTPSSFHLILHDLKTLGLTELSVADQYSPGGSEFFFVLSRETTSNSVDRVKLLLETQKEVANGVSPSFMRKTHIRFRRSITKRLKQLSVFSALDK